MPYLQVRGLNKFYQVRSDRIHVLRDLELDVEHGQMVAVIGASGVGKSTLLHLLGGLDRPDSGSIMVADVDLRALSDSAPGRCVKRCASPTRASISSARVRRSRAGVPAIRSGMCAFSSAENSGRR